MSQVVSFILTLSLLLLIKEKIHKNIQIALCNMQNQRRTMQNQWRTQERGLGGPDPPPRFTLRSNWGPKGQKIFFWRPGPPFSEGLDDRHPPDLKVWIRHGKVLPNWFHLNGNTMITFCGQIQKCFFLVFIAVWLQESFKKIMSCCNKVYERLF